MPVISKSSSKTVGYVCIRKNGFVLRYVGRKVRTGDVTVIPTSFHQPPVAMDSIPQELINTLRARNRLLPVHGRCYVASI